MPRTRARQLAAGIGAVSLAAGLAFLGGTGQAEAATNLREVYCYKNPDGTPNPDRIHVSQVVVSDPTPEGLFNVTWRSETEVWVEISKNKTYTNPTFTWVNYTINNTDPTSIKEWQSTPDAACLRMANGGNSGYERGIWG